MNLSDFGGFTRSVLPTRMLPSALLGGAIGYPMYILFLYVMTNHYPEKDVNFVTELAFICPCFVLIYFISALLGIFGLRDELQSHLDALGYLSKKANLTPDDYAKVHRRVLDAIVDMTSPAYKASLQIQSASLRNQSSKPKGAE